MRLIKLIVLSVIVSLILSSVITTYGQSGEDFVTPDVTPNIRAIEGFYDSEGKIFGKRAQQTMKPKTIIETIRMSNGYGSLTLNNRFTQGQHNVAPTSIKNIYVFVSQILDDSTQQVISYSWWFDNDRIGIKSDSSWDSSKIQIMAIVK